LETIEQHGNHTKPVFIFWSECDNHEPLELGVMYGSRPFTSVQILYETFLMMLTVTNTVIDTKF